MKGKLTYMLTCGLCLGLLAGVSCVKQGLDLREEEGYVRIDLKWENDVVPEGSEFYFYTDAGEFVQSCKCSAKGFRGTLPMGAYKIIVWNTDARNVELYNMNRHATAEVRVVADAAAAGKAAGCIAQPDNLLFAAAFDEAEVMTVPYRDSVIMSASPRGRIKTVELVFKLDNAAAVKLLGGSLSGVSSGLQCSTASCTHNPQSVNFTVTSDPYGKYNYVANISVLDLVMPESGVSGSHILTLTLMIDGVEHTMSIDLSSTIEDLLEGEWNGVIPLEIPLEVDLKSVDGNLSAEVSPWDTTGSGSGELV